MKIRRLFHARDRRRRDKHVELPHLSSNAIADAGPRAGLTALERLDLSDASPLGDLSELVWLRLPGNPVADAAPLGRLTLLRWLWLDAGVEGRGLLDVRGRPFAASLWIGAGNGRKPGVFAREP